MNDQATILAVDDTPASLALLVKVLTNAGYHVRPADSGELALAAVAANPPDLILLDVRMQGMDGLDVCRQLKARAETQRIPVILMSAFADVQEWVAGLQLGAADYINKPFQAEELLTRVMTHLTLSRATVSLEQQAATLRRTNEQLQAEIAERQHVAAELHQSLERTDHSRQAMLGALEDQKQTVTALQASEAKLRTMIANAPIGIVFLDAEGHLLIANAKYESLVGYSAEQLKGMVFADITHPDDLAEDLRFYRDMVAGNIDQYQLEKRYIHRNGNAIWVRLTCGVTERKQDQPAHFIAMVEDITARKQAEVILQESERRQASLISNLPGFVYRCANDRDWTMEYISDGCRSITGYAPADLIGNRKLCFNDIVHTNYREPLWQQWQKQLRAQQPFEEEYPITTARGEIRWVWERGRGVFAADGQLLFLEGFIADITERRQAEEALRQEKIFTDKLLNAQSDTIFLFEPATGKPIRWNERFAEVSGYSHEEIAGMKAPDDFYDADDLRKAMETTAKISAEGQGRVEISLVTKQGRHIPFEYAATVVKTMDGRTLILSVGRDVTARRQAEEELRLSHERFHLLSRGTHDTVWDWDLTSDALWWNENFQTLFGYPAEEIEPGIESWTNRIHAEDRQRVVTGIHAAIDGGTHFWSSEYRFRHKDGSYVEVHDRGYILRDAGGSAVRMIGTMQDITTRKRVEQERQALLTTVEQEKMRLAALIDGITDEVWFADTHKIFTLANPSALREFGLDRDAAIAVEVEKLAQSLEVLRPDGSPRPVEEAPPLRALAGEVIRNEEEIVRTPATGELRYRQVSSTPVKDPEGHVIGSVSVVRDITDHKREEQELHHVLSSANCILWHALVTAMAGGGFDWQLRVTNEVAAEALLPLPRKPGQAYSDAWHSNKPREDIERMNRISTQALRAGKPGYTQEFRCRTPQGEIRWFAEDAWIQALGPDRWLVVGVCTDITARRKAEQQMQQQLDELRRWQAVTLGREGRIGELKREVNALAARLGQPPPYATQSE